MSNEPQAAVVVLLKSGKEITSPAMPQSEADEAMKTLSRSQHQGGPAMLSWISVRGSYIEAVHVQPRASARLRAA